MVEKDLNYINLNLFINNFFQDTLKVAFKNIGMDYYISKAIRNQNNALKKRLLWEKQGLHVPPFMIVSVTNRCNLKCKACYFYAQNRVMVKEMNEEMLSSILEEARELGISIIFIAGGEPLIREDLLKITEKYSDIIFLIFSNGLLIDDELVGVLKKQKHIIPIISLEGYEDETDERRGLGIFERLIKIIEAMKRKKIFFGISLTVTRNNFNSIFSDNYIEQFINSGCKIFFFVEYIPVQEGTDDLVITENQKSEIPNLMASLRSKYPVLFVAFPGDEEKFGGCLGAGRGLIHISPEGAVEPCPFVPFSDADLNHLSLREALRSSKLLRKIRDNFDKLEKSKGGCVLWESREWVSDGKDY